MDLYFEDQEITDKGKQATKIKIAIGDEGMRRILSSGLSIDEKKKPDKIYKLLEQQLDASVKINFRVHRLEFSQLRQNADENITDFVSRLRDKASKCDFDADELNQRLIEMVISSTPNDDFRKELLTKPKEYKVSELIEKGREFEAISASQMTIRKIFGGKAQAYVDNSESAPIHAYTQQRRNPCSNCNLRHAYRECPAYNDRCIRCRKKGHWSKCCRSTKSKQFQPEAVDGNGSKTDDKQKYGSKSKFKQHEVGLDDENSSDSGKDDYTKVFYSISSGQSTEAFCKLDVRHVRITENGRLCIKIDTGAAGNTLPLRTYHQMFNVKPELMLKPEPKVKLTSYSNNVIPCIGSIVLGIKKKSQSSHIFTKFYVVDVDGPPILGLRSCKALDIVDISIDVVSQQSYEKPATSVINSVDDLKQLYPDRFDVIGNFKREEELVIKPGAEPFIDPPRKCPIHLREKIKQKLDEMVSNDIIKPISKPTQWCSSITYPTKKDGSLRICLDPKKLNSSLVKRPHKIPNVEEITPSFTKAKYFSKLDAKSGYWSVRLTKSSQELTTFRTPFGRYCFKRLPFGLNIAQDAYQERMDEILEKCDGVTGISDDIVVYGETEKQHDSNLLKLMDTARKDGLVFNSEKCNIKTDKITFFGRQYTDKGVYPDPEKVKDVIEMPTPQNKSELQTFLGMITFLSNHLPNASAKTAILRDLIKDNVPYEWSEDHEQAFNVVKRLVSTNIGLKYFDPRENACLEVDASIKGLGAVLTQNGLPTAFASKSLSSAQANYSNLERECLAVVFGIQRFHHFLFGKEFEVVTDCKPLEMIFRKPLHSAPPRLQRIMIKVQGYNFNVSYKPGSDNIIPDTLSRLPNPSSREVIELDNHVDVIDIDMFNFSYDKQAHIRTEIQRDTGLKNLIQIIYEGWPSNIKDLPYDVRPYWNYRDELGVANGIIYKGHQIIIPENMREDILNQLHEGHQGVEKTRRLARQCVYWPNFNKDIEKICSSCKFCQQHQPKQQREPIISHEIPNKRWVKVGTDLFSIKDRNYLIIADYFSRYPYIKEIKSMTGKAVVKATKECFSIFGIPSEIISDNGPCYLTEYNDMCQKLGITHTTVSPRHPQGNGFIERQVGYVKSVLIKCMESGNDIDIALLNLRATPIDQYLPSPAELMFGSKVSVVLPSRNCEPSNDYNVERMKAITENQKMYGDCGTKSLRPLLNGENVRIFDHDRKIWFQGKILYSQGERSYVLQTEGGRILRRNRVQLKPYQKANETTQPGDSSIGKAPDS